jgi:hypothetical protein
MKTVYISEKILESEEFKKSILMDALPDDVIVKINTHKTSLGNNPSIPDIFDEPFLLKLTEQGFQLSKEKLKEIGEITDVDETELEPALAKLLLQCKELETPYRNELEKICINYVIDLFSVPEETVDIVTELCDEVDLNRDSIILDPLDNDGDVEFVNVEDAMSIKGEVYKRRLLNALSMGAAIRMTDIESLSEEINQLNPRLIDLYNKIISLNNYLLYTKSDFGLTDENKMQMGTVEVSLATEDSKVKIEAQGVIFPILLTELIRGFMELFTSHGLPKDRQQAMMVIGKSDFLKAEPWDMKLGPMLWDLLSNTFNDINSVELPYLLKRISKLNVNKFNYLMKEIFAKTKQGKLIMASLSFNAKNDIEYDKFVDKMTKMKKDKGVITDEFIHPDEL